MKLLVRDLQNFINKKECITCKNKLEFSHEDKTSGIRIKSRGGWFEQEEKATKSFLYLEKHFCGILFKNKELAILKLLKLYTSLKTYFSNKNQNIIKAFSIINIKWSQFT